MFREKPNLTFENVTQVHEFNMEHIKFRYTYIILYMYNSNYWLLTFELVDCIWSSLERPIYSLSLLWTNYAKLFRTRYYKLAICSMSVLSHVICNYGESSWPKPYVNCHTLPTMFSKWIQESSAYMKYE